MRLPLKRRDDDPAPAGADAVEIARTRARRRLIGAVVLLAIGIVGFPPLFETEPRPVALDVPIVTAAREAQAPRASAPSRQPPAADAPAADAPVEEARPAASTPGATPSSRARPEAPAVAASAAEPAAAPPAAPVATAATATALPGVKAAAGAASAPGATAAARAASAVAEAAAPAPSAPARGRFVVQVGAYTDPARLREARARVERLGLKTYTQVIESDAGRRTRVRVGPFATRDDANAAIARLEAAGLPAHLLAL
jgi:DedD protein